MLFRQIVFVPLYYNLITSVGPVSLYFTPRQVIILPKAELRIQKNKINDHNDPPIISDRVFPERKMGPVFVNGISILA
ncbi:MAG: hypothetical protein NTW93_06445 [Phycisphaerae bacterium]|nr:hypothetical protein [Phycisphaerae bacterium]